MFDEFKNAIAYISTFQAHHHIHFGLFIESSLHNRWLEKSDNLQQWRLGVRNEFMNWAIVISVNFTYALARHRWAEGSNSDQTGSINSQPIIESSFQKYVCCNESTKTLSGWVNTKGRIILNQIDLRPCKKIADATPWRVCAHTMTNDNEPLVFNLIESLVLETTRSFA